MSIAVGIEEGARHRLGRAAVEQGSQRSQTSPHKHTERQTRQCVVRYCNAARCSRLEGKAIATVGAYSSFRSLVFGFFFFKVFWDRVLLYSRRIIDVSHHVWFTVLL